MDKNKRLEVAVKLASAMPQPSFYTGEESRRESLKVWSSRLLELAEILISENENIPIPDKGQWDKTR